MGNGSEMTSHVRSGDLLSAEEVRAELALILASPAFAHSPRLAAFLRFVVESRLTGVAFEDLRVGMPVELTLVPLRTDPDGTAVVTYAFRPVTGGAS